MNFPPGTSKTGSYTDPAFDIKQTWKEGTNFIQSRSKRNRVDRKNMIQVCKNPIVKDDFHGFLHRNCEDIEQLRRNK